MKSRSAKVVLIEPAFIRYTLRSKPVCNCGDSMIELRDEEWYMNRYVCLPCNTFEYVWDWNST